MLLLVISYCLLRCKSSLESILKLVECYSVAVLLHMIRLLYRFKRGVICFVSLSFAKVGSVYAENIVRSLYLLRRRSAFDYLPGFGAGVYFLVVWYFIQFFSSSCLASFVGFCSGVCLLSLAAL